VDQELPRFDLRRTGTDLRYLYTGETGLEEDPFAFTHIVRHDLKRDRALRAGAGRGRAFGEPVFVPRPGESEEDQGWLMVMGYDAPRDETYLEIQDAATLEFQARVWTGLHLPLGFHGNFVSDRFVTIKES
jgi:carotenoid cleavage dioxygenase-like enzyme